MLPRPLRGGGGNPLSRKRGENRLIRFPPPPKYLHESGRIRRSVCTRSRKREGGPHLRLAVLSFTPPFPPAPLFLHGHAARFGARLQHVRRRPKDQPRILVVPEVVVQSVFEVAPLFGLGAEPSQRSVCEHASIARSSLTGRRFRLSCSPIAA